MSYYGSCSCETGNWKVEFVLFEERIESEDLGKASFSKLLMFFVWGGKSCFLSTLREMYKEIFQRYFLEVVENPSAFSLLYVLYDYPSSLKQCPDWTTDECCQQWVNQ